MKKPLFSLFEKIIYRQIHSTEFAYDFLKNSDWTVFDRYANNLISFWGTLLLITTEFIHLALDIYKDLLPYKLRITIIAVYFIAALVMFNLRNFKIKEKTKTIILSGIFSTTIYTTAYVSVLDNNIQYYVIVPMLLFVVSSMFYTRIFQRMVLGSAVTARFLVYFMVPEVPVLQVLTETVFFFLAYLASVISNNLYKATLQKSIENYVFDPVTGLVNRNFLIEQIENIRKNHNSTMIVVDIKDFKEIGNIQGIKFSDSILNTVAIRIKDNIGSGGIVSRFSDTAFIAVIFDRKSNDIDLKQFESFVSAPVNIKDIKTKINLNIAVAEITAYEDFNEAIRKTTTALYYNDTGGNIKFYSEEMDKKVQEEVNFVLEIEKAFEKKEFEIYYQPQVYSDGNESKIVGAEALLRWNSVKYGYVSPYKLITIAEKTGQIAKIGKWILKSETDFLVNQLKNKIPISINVSAKQLEDDNFIDELTELTSEINKDKLEIEITETILANENIFSKLNKIRSMGIGIALDDFGTGYSSLSVIQNINISKIKIDKSFVDVLKEDNPKELVSTMIKLADQLKIKTVIEGVEEKTQVNKILKLSPNIFQGYYFYKPMDKKSFLELVT